MQFDYYDYQTRTITERIKKEMEAIKKLELFKLSMLHQNYYNYLDSRIAHDKVLSNNVKIKNITKMEDLKMTSQSDMDQMLYNKPWHRLKETHKQIKFRNFVAALKYKTPNPKNRQYILKELTNGLKLKKFGQSKVQVNYDQDDMKILEVQCLSYNKKKDIYEIEW